MHEITFYFLLLFVGVACLMVAISVPLIRGKVRPNALYGVRTPRTLADERVWYEANAYGGRLLLGAGLVQLAGVVGLYCVPALRGDVIAYTVSCGGVILGGLVVAVGLLVRRLTAS